MVKLIAALTVSKDLKVSNFLSLIRTHVCCDDGCDNLIPDRIERGYFHTHRIA